MKKQIKITLLPNGEIQMKTHGIKGKKCLKYVELLKMLTDAEVVKQEYTKEYYETEEEYVKNNEEQNLFEL